jgi:tetratricopeptide (TPR) repeat protein
MADRSHRDCEGHRGRAAFRESSQGFGFGPLPTLLAVLVLAWLCADVAAGRALATESSKGSDAACREAKALLAQGRVNQAETAYLEALGTNNGMRCADTALTRLDRGGQLCKSAEALADQGRAEEAKTAYVTVLTAVPQSECASAGLESLRHTWFLDGEAWDDFADASADVLKAFGLLAVLGGFVLAVLVLLSSVLARWRRTREWPPARWFVRPALAVETFGDSGFEPSFGAAMTGLVRTRLETGGKSPLLHTAPGQLSAAETWTSKLAEMGEEGAMTAALVNLLLITLPRRRFSAGGELQPDDGKGVGISLTVGGGQSFAAGADLWANDIQLPLDISAAESVRRMATPAAAWLTHRTMTAADIPPAEARDPMSWALYKAALEWDMEGDSGKAWELASEAYGRDRTNYAALVYLALIDAGAGDYRDAIVSLSEARRIIVG